MRKSVLTALLMATSFLFLAAHAFGGDCGRFYQSKSQRLSQRILAEALSVGSIERHLKEMNQTLHRWRALSAQSASQEKPMKLLDKMLSYREGESEELKILVTVFGVRERLGAITGVPLSIKDESFPNVGGAHWLWRDTLRKHRGLWSGEVTALHGEDLDILLPPGDKGPNRIFPGEFINYFWAASYAQSGIGKRAIRSLVKFEVEHLDGIGNRKRSHMVADSIAQDLLRHGEWFFEQAILLSHEQ